MDRRTFIEKVVFAHLAKMPPGAYPGNYTMESWATEANMVFNHIEKLPEIKEEREMVETATREMHEADKYYNAISGDHNGEGI